jgi:hypothetical protein
MDHLLAGPYFGRKWKDMPDAQCRPVGGLCEKILIAMKWMVLQLGGGEARTHKTGGRISRWITSWLALALGASGRTCQMRSAVQLGGFAEFLIAMKWMVLQLGGRSTYTQNGWSNFAMIDLLPGPCWLRALALGFYMGSCDI